MNMLEGSAAFMRTLKKLETVKFADLVELQEFQQKMDFFAITEGSKTGIATYRLPIIKTIFITIVKALHNLENGKSMTVDGYLEHLQANKAFTEAIFRFAKKKEIVSEEGFKTYAFYAETSKLPTDIIVIAPAGIGAEATPNLPYSVKLEKIGRLYDKEDCRSVFLLKDEPEPTILKIPKVDTPFPVLSLKELRKGLLEISSLSTGDHHISDSLLSPFVGSDLYDKKILVDGIGASYIRNPGLEEDVNRLNDILKTSAYGLSLEHFGVLNVSSPGLVAQIDEMRNSPEALQKLKVLSWNMPTSKDANNLKLSEFRYKSEAINIDSERDIRNNIAFQHSLAYYAILKGKTVPQSVYDEAFLKAVKYIDSLNEGKSVIFDSIIDENRLPVQVGRIASFYTAFDTLNITDITKKTIVTGIDSTVDDAVSLQSERASREIGLSEKHAVGRGVPLGVWAAIFSSDRTKNSIVEKLIDKFGWSAKSAEEKLKSMHEQGIIICPDGVHYRLLNETRFKFGH